MEGLKEIRVFRKDEYGKKAYVKEVEVGKWYKFPCIVCGEDLTAYGKVVSINGEMVKVVKYFTLQSYRPYAAHKWFDDLPLAVAQVSLN